MNMYNKLMLEQDQIDGISQNPLPDITVGDLENAEDDIQKKKENETIDDHENDEVKMQTKLDVADVAIFDNSVSDGVDEDLNQDSESTSMYQELSDYIQISKMLDTLSAEPGNEGLLKDAFTKLSETSFKALKKLAKCAHATEVYVTDKVANLALQQDKVAAMWSFSLKNKIANIDDEDLKNYNLTAFEHSEWVKIAHVAISAFDILKTAKNIVFSNSSSSELPSMHKLAEMFEDIGVVIDTASNTIDKTKLMDKCLSATAYKLNYHDNISDVMNCFGELGKRISRHKKDLLQPVFDDVISKVANDGANIQHSAESGDLDKDSSEYRVAVDNVILHTARLDFLLNSRKVVYYLFSILSYQAIAIIKIYRKAKTIKRSDD